jgi:hypothetical protein
MLSLSVVRACLTARKVILMRFELSQTLPPGGSGRPWRFLPMLLIAAVALTSSPARAADAGNDHPAKQTEIFEPGASTAPSLCDALATAAATNDLPVDFFNRLIWQESRFRPDAISPKGAQGIAQFMPETARLSGLENPFDPFEAIAKSSRLLRGLRDEFGNLGLAAAAYNAGSGRVRDWLGGRRPLPQETRAYVQVVTGRTVEEWAGSPANPAALLPLPSLDSVPCNEPGAGTIRPRPDAVSPRPETVKPWGVVVVGGPTAVTALARYREWQTKYPAILAEREPRVVMRGIMGQMGAAQVRLDEDTRAGADKLCRALKAAGTYCDVWRNR